MRAKKARETDSVQVQFVRVLLLQGYEKQFRRHARARGTDREQTISHIAISNY